MKKDIDEETINEILALSQQGNKELHSKITTLVDSYNHQKKFNEKVVRENNFLLKKCNKRNTLQDEKKDEIMEQQSRLAAMGEMIDAVAHQWKQPLNAVSMMIEMLEDDFETGEVNSAYIKDLNSSIHLQINHMVNTLGEFRNFLRPSTKNETFHINTVIHNVKTLMKDELIAQNLHIDCHIEDSLKMYGNKNEFIHLFINLINNSIDAFNDHNITSRKVDIRGYRKDSQITLEIEDNAGGVPNNIINHIFKPNVTTKAEGKGTGIGLYMSSQIVVKNNGSIVVENIEDGALFTITLHDNNI